MRYILILLMAFTLLSSVLNNIYPQDKSPIKLSGLVFGDYFYKVQGDSSGSIGEYAPFKKDYQAFDLRRVIFNYEHSISDKFTANFTLEGGNKYLLTGRFSVIIKTAYLEWKNIFPGSNLYAGYFPSPSFVWGVSEKMWGYRSVEKTICDFRGLTTAVDIGVGLRGYFDKKMNYGYFIMIGNGTGTKPEFNKYKNYFVSLNAKPFDNFVAEVYTEYEAAENDKSKLSLKGVLAYQHPEFTVGTEVIDHIKKNAGINNANVNPFGISLFARGILIKDKKTKEPVLGAFARYDMYDPDMEIKSSGYKENFVTAGFDYMPAANVHFMPNIWINSYAAKDPSLAERKADIVGRMTFYFVFK